MGTNNTTITDIAVEALGNGAITYQRGYVGYYSSTNYVMRYTFTTPTSFDNIQTLTFKTYILQPNANNINTNNRVLVRILPYGDNSYINANGADGYTSQAVMSLVDGNWLQCAINSPDLKPNTKYYIYQFPESRYSTRHLIHNSNATTESKIILGVHTHDYSDPSKICTEGSYCTSCNEVFQQPLGHDMKPATCLFPSHCNNRGCNYTEGEALGHDWENAKVEVTVKPTFTTEGNRRYTCQRENDGVLCGFIKDEVIPKLQGAARIQKKSGPAMYGIHIYDKTQWVRCAPYVYDGTNWKPCN